MLHITNGDAARAVLEGAVQGEVLPWRDVLHEGPVHAHLALDELSKVRADFIATAGWGSLVEVQRQFSARDATLAGSAAHEEVVLWFEHDLYDQLQLIQVLDGFATRPHPRLTLVCEAQYLGTMPRERAAALFASRRKVTRGMLEQGAAAWKAFASPRPAGIALEPRRELPFLAPALRRHLEEFPWVTDGLSRLERQALSALSAGALDFQELYHRAHHEQEDPLWLGDTVFAWHLERLVADGLVQRAQSRWQLTGKARGILSGKADAWDDSRQPRWLGGFLLGAGRPRWDCALGALR